MVYAAIALAAIAITMVLTMKAPSQRKQGKTIEDPGALANQARWGDPIPEIAGAPRTYPDYIAPPRRYYLNQTQQWVDSLVCIGMGRKYQLDASQVFIGDTSAPTMGDDIEIRFFQPGEEIPSPYRDWWHTPEEVGFTTFGGSGLTLGAAADIARHWHTGVLPIYGHVGFAFAGSSVTGGTPPPASWSTGLFLSASRLIISWFLAATRAV